MSRSVLPGDEPNEVRKGLKAASARLLDLSSITCCSPTACRGFEIPGYLLRLVGKWQFRRHLRLRTAIVGAHFEEERGVWSRATNSGETVYKVGPRFPGSVRCGRSGTRPHWRGRTLPQSGGNEL